MTEENQDPKEKFRLALEKKRQANNPTSKELSKDSSAKGGQSKGKTQKMFRRKSGTS